MKWRWNPDGDARSADRVEDHQERDVDGSDEATPRHRNGGDDREQRDDDEEVEPEEMALGLHFGGVEGLGVGRGVVKIGELCGHRYILSKLRHRNLRFRNLSTDARCDDDGIARYSVAEPIPGSSKGRTTGFGPVNGGSNPPPGAH